MAGSPLSHDQKEVERLLRRTLRTAELPAPTESFRRRAWVSFERALDPLGTPRARRPRWWRRNRRAG